MSARDVSTGIDDPDDVRSLLTDALSWEGRDVFEWRYDQFPGFDPDEHAFSVIDDGDVVAFRRLFDREIDTGDELLPVHVYGGTAVRPDYRGQGLYSKLLERTNQYSENEGVPVAMTFNTKGTITYEAKRDRGWSHRELPLQICVLSPSTVLEEYAGDVLGPESIPGPLAGLGSRFHVDTTDGRFEAASLLRSEGQAVPKRTIGVGLSNEAVTDLVEAAATDGGTFSSLVRTGLDVLRRRDVSFRGSPDQETPGSSAPETASGLTLERRQVLDDAELRRAVELCQTDRPTFRRERRDVEHLLAYPESDTLLAYRDEELVGLAVLGPRSNGDVTEGWILELAAERLSVERELAAHAVHRAAEREFDLVAVFSPEDLGRDWAAVDQQVFMWQSLQDTQRVPFDLRDLSVSLYDAL